MPGDLKANGLQLEDGEFKCHKRADIQLTPYGDMALEEDLVNITQTEIGFWLGTVCGERLDPQIGCVLHDYIFAKAAVSMSIVGEIENVLAMNLRQNFPHLPFKYVRVQMAGETTNTLLVHIVFTNDALKFLVSGEELEALRRMLKITATMEFVNGGLYGGS